MPIEQTKEVKLLIFRYFFTVEIQEPLCIHAHCVRGFSTYKKTSGKSCTLYSKLKGMLYRYEYKVDLGQTVIALFQTAN